MRAPVALALVLASCVATGARAFSWARDYSAIDNGFVGAIPPSGDRILAWSSGGLIVAINPGGAIAWQEMLGCNGGTCSLSRIRSVPSGGFVACFGGMVVRLEDDGALRWAVQADGFGIMDVAPLSSGEIGVVGSIPTGSLLRAYDGWVAVLADDGSSARSQS